jgi:hypothetical protein
MGKALADVASLPPKERAASYREFAREVEVWAMHARSAELRDGYREVAEHWRQLADEIEPHGNPFQFNRPTPSSPATEPQKTRARSSN